MRKLGWCPGFDLGEWKCPRTWQRQRTLPGAALAVTGRRGGGGGGEVVPTGDTGYNRRFGFAIPGRGDPSHRARNHHSVSDLGHALLILARKWASRARAEHTTFPSNLPTTIIYDQISSLKYLPYHVGCASPVPSNRREGKPGGQGYRPNWGGLSPPPQ